MGNINLPCIIVIFGGTGDLTHRKLIPAIYHMKYQGLIDNDFAVVTVGRRDKTDQQYRNEIRHSIKMFSRYKIDEKVWNELMSKVFYKKLDLLISQEYKGLRDFLSDLDESHRTLGNRIFYLAVAPENYGPIINNLRSNQMTENKSSWQRVVIEKPIGNDLKSARLLNQTIAEVFPEENIYRIDHYLGKEMVRSILGIRFANSVFEPLWNNQFIDNIQISSCETMGIENRGEYYEKSGAVGDMVQNHILQMLALITMEPPVSFDAEYIRDEKVKLLRSIEKVSLDAKEENVVLGQYSRGKIGRCEIPGYREELNVSPDSNTETFAALKLKCNNQRWSGIPFFIRTGKRLASKFTEIVVQFKAMPSMGFFNGANDLEPNLLVIRVQPTEEVLLQFNTKKPGIHSKICPVKMNFCQNCAVCEAKSNSSEAYEKLLYDIINGDSTLFARWDEVEESWKIIEEITIAKRNIKLEFPNYLPGSWGPEKANALLAKEKKHWWNPEVKNDDL